MNVLFIGNSQMRYCDLPLMIKTLSESAPPDRPRIESADMAQGGKTLKLHWEAGEGEDTPRGAIAKGGWDAVVVQEIYSASKADFEPYAERFLHAIQAAGSRMILFATASVSCHYNANYSYPESFETFNDMQIEFGEKHGVPVAAAGYAWIRYLGPSPSEEALLDLYAEDRGHPGWKGSYIYACLLYATLTGESPEGLTKHVKGRRERPLSDEEALKMQRAR